MIQQNLTWYDYKIKKLIRRVKFFKYISVRWDGYHSIVIFCWKIKYTPYILYKLKLKIINRKFTGLILTSVEFFNVYGVYTPI